MKYNMRRKFAIFITALLLFQMMPAAFLGALADGVEAVIVGHLQPLGMYYTVQFVNEGAVIAEQYVQAGFLAVRPEDPTREAQAGEGDVGIVFDGWLSNNGTLVTAPIEDDTVFTAQYRSIAKTAITIKYALSDHNPNQVTVPPPRIYDVQVGTAAGIHEKLPIIVGYKPVDPIVTVQDDYYYITYNHVVNASVEYTITYVKQDPINYQVKYWVEKPNLPGTVDHENLANFEEIPAYGYAATDDFNQQIVPPSLSDRVGGPTMSNGLEVAGFSRLPLTYKPLTKAHVYNELYSRNSYVLSFDVGAEGAKYIAPKSVKYGASLPLPAKADMYKPGYEFVEWLPKDVASGKMPAENITLTASWKPKTANVKVIYLIEEPDAVPNGGTPSMANPAHYKFFDTKDVAYTVGQPAVYNNDRTQITAPTGGSGVNANRVIATLQGYEQGVVVKGDGSSVMKVYFKLVPFTLTFNPNGGKMANGSTAKQSFIFKYGQDLTADWPAGNNSPTKSGSKYTGWSKGNVLASGESTGTVWVTMRWTFTDKMLPTSSLSGYELTANWESANTYNVEYMFNAHPGQNANGKTTDTHNGKTYIKDGIGDYSQIFYSTQMNLSPKEIEGTNSKNEANVGVKNLTVDGVTTRRFFYDRLQYGLIFDTMTTQYGKINASRLVYYAEPLSSFAPSLTGYTDVNGTYYTLTGWYRDADLTVPIDLTTAKMPHVPDQSGVTPPLTLFAKWTPSDATVSFQVLGNAYGTPQTVSAGEALGASLFPAQPTEVGYDFFGWVDANGDPFTASTLVYKSQTIRADLRPVRVQYTVEYIFNGPNGVQHLLPAKIDNTKFFGDEVTEIAPEINGYAVNGSAIGWRKLGINYDQNVITFVYKQQTVFKYNVKYLIEGTNTPVPGYTALTDQLSTSFRVVLWPKQDANSRYYPVLAVQMVELKANETLDIIFYYREYTYVKYNEVGYAIAGDGSEKIAYTIPRETRIGDTAKPTRTDTSITFEASSYGYVPDAREVASYLVRTASDSFTLKRYYSQACTITFSVNDPAYGSLNGAASVSAVIGKPWSTVAVPTPVPNPGCYFVKWTPAFPATVSGSATYMAEFSKRSTLTIVADSKNVTYDANVQAAGTGFTVLEGGLPTTAYTVQGYAAEGVQATNAGDYTNKLVQTGTLKVIDNATGTDITTGATVTPQNGTLSIAKRPVTFKAADVSYAFDGTPKSAATYADYALASGSLSLAIGHNAEAVANSIVGQGVLPGPYTLSFLIAPQIKNASNQDVTANYTITLENGTLNITEGPTKPTVTFKANNETATYTGFEIVPKNGYTATPVLGGDSTGTFITQASTQATGAVAPGKHSITVTGAKVLWKDNASGQTTDMSAMFNIVTENGELTINPITVEADKIPITVLADSHGASYTGELIQFTGSGTLVSGTLGDPAHVQLVMVSKGQGTAAITYPITFDSVKVVCDSVDVTGSYKITENNGTLTISHQACTITFSVNNAAYGSLTGATTVTANINEPWSTVTVPTPVPKSGYYFMGWKPVFPAKVTGSATYVAEFGQQKVLTIVADSNTFVYDATEHSAGNGITIQEGGSPTNDYIVEGYAAEGVKGTNANTYENKVIQTGAFKVTEVSSGKDITGSISVQTVNGTLTIDKRLVTIKPVDASFVFDGTVKTPIDSTEYAPGSQTLAAGHHLNMPSPIIGGQGVLPGVYGLTIMQTPKVEDALNGDVTANYTIVCADGTLTIEEDNNNKPVITFKASDQTATYTGFKFVPAQEYTVAPALNGGTVGTYQTAATISVTDAVSTGKYPLTLTGAKIEWTDSLTGTTTDVTGYFTIVPVSGELTINPITDESKKIPITVQADSSEAFYTGNAIHFTGSGTLTSGTPGDPAFISLEMPSSGEGTETGNHPVTFDYVKVLCGTDDMTGNYKITKKDGNLEIKDQACTITFSVNNPLYGHLDGATTVSANLNKPWSTVAVPTPVPNDASYYFIRWTPTFPATVTGTATYVAEFGRKSNLAIVANDTTVVYDATMQTASKGFTVYDGGFPTTAYTIEGYAAEGKQAVDAGNYENKIIQTGVFKVIRNSDGEDITSAIAVETFSGTLTIDKRIVTIKPEDISVPFDGAAKETNGQFVLAPGSLQMAADHVVDLQSPTGIIAGQGVLPGTYTLTITATWAVTGSTGAPDYSANYDIRYEDGTLTITEDGANKPIVTFSANDETVNYSGFKVTLANGYSVTPLLDGGSVGTYTTEATTSVADVVNPGKYPITLTGSKIWWTPNDSTAKQDVSAYFEIKNVNGELTIKANDDEIDKIPITVLADSYETLYTSELIQFTGAGTLTAGTLGDPTHVHLEMVSKGEGVTPGNYQVEFVSVKVISDGDDMTGNYTISKLPGNLKIMELPDEDRFPITVRADDAPSAMYAAQTLYATSNSGTVTAGMANMPEAWNGNTYKITLSAAASGYAPGNYPLTFGANTCQIFYGNDTDGWEDITANYIVTPQAGNFRILDSENKSTLRIVPENFEAIYNMQQQSVSVTHLTMTANTVITIDGQPVPNELRVEFAAAGTGITPGLHPITVDQGKVKVIVKDTNDDVTNQYLQDHGTGTFTIKNRETNKAKITITPDNKTLPYLGYEQTVNLDDQGTITYDGSTTLPALMSVTFKASGTGFAPKAYPITVTSNSPLVMQDGEDVTTNFDIDVFDGVFTITSLKDDDRIPVSIKPDNAPSVTYTGEKMGASVNTGEIKVNNVPHTSADSVTVTFIASTEGGIAHDTYKMTVHDEKVIAKDGLDTDVTDNYVFDNDTGDFVILPKDPGGDKIAMTLYPANRTATYDGGEIAVTVTDTRTQTLVNSLPIPPGTLTVTFAATGKGSSVGPHPITILDKTDRSQFKVMAPGENGTPKDVTDQYALTVDDGTLTIQNRLSKIKITIGIVDPVPFTYDGTEKSVSAHVGKVTDIESGFDATNLQVTVLKEVKGTDAASYPIVFDDTDVTIKLGGSDETENYEITTVPGTMKINKKPIVTSAKLTAVRPGASFTYGAAIPAPTAEWEPASLASEGLVYSIIASPDADPKNIGTYTYTPVLDADDNPNHDVSGVTLVASAPMEIEEAELLVTPNDVWHKQGTPILPSEFTYVISGYQHGETQASVGPATVTYGAMSATGNEPIGTKDDIILVAGDLAANYDVVYNGNPGGFGISGEVFYHANYEDQPDEVVAHGDYRAQTDPVNPVDPSVLGLGKPSLYFTAWYLDAALTQPFTAGTAIGPNSIHLYAKWAQAYKMTISHELSTGETVAAQEEIWRAEGVQYTFTAKTLDLYEPLYVMYYANGVTYMYQLGKTITTLGMDTEATIVYKAKAVPPPIQTFSMITAPLTEGTFTLFPDDIPTQGVVSGTGVPREPARLSID